MCCQKLFARLQKLYSLGGHKVPTMISGLLFPSPHSEEGERLKAEGALACKEGNMRKKRKLAQVVDLTEPVKFRMVGEDGHKLTMAQAKLFRKGFEIQYIRASEVEDSDVSRKKLHILLQLIKAGRNPLGWEKGERY